MVVGVVEASGEFVDVGVPLAELFSEALVFGTQLVVDGDAFIFFVLEVFVFADEVVVLLVVELFLLLHFALERILALGKEAQVVLEFVVPVVEETVVFFISFQVDDSAFQLADDHVFLGALVHDDFGVHGRVAWATAWTAAGGVGVVIRTSAYV